MLVIRPDYYKEFQCIAGDCPATCCAGWEIEIDARSMKRYKNMKGSFANRMLTSINQKEQCFHQYKDRCVFLNDENLCDLYADVGKDYLCKTCKTYPRHIEEYSSITEISLAISCPEVANLLLHKSDPIQLQRKNIEQKKQDNYTVDLNLYHHLDQARNILLNILQNRTIDIYDRIGLVLA